MKDYVVFSSEDEGVYIKEFGGPFDCIGIFISVFFKCLHNFLNASWSTGGVMV
jgi:hypothetical protein